MDKRKQYVIDKGFQLKHTRSILKWDFIAIAVIIILIGVNAFYNYYTLNQINGSNESTTKHLDEIVVMQDNILETVMTWALKTGKPDKMTVKDVAREHVKNIGTIRNDIDAIKQNVESQKKIVKYTNIMIINIIVLIIILGILLYYVMIRKTHKMAGPLYVMSNYMKDVINGKYPDNLRSLREGDEFQEFYDVFKKMIDTIKNK